MGFEWPAFHVVCLIVDPLGDPGGGLKGKTWGPSTMQRDRVQRSASSSLVMADTARHSKSAPNLDKTLRHLGGGHSNIGALQEMGAFFAATPFVSPIVVQGSSLRTRHPRKVMQENLFLLTRRKKEFLLF